MWPESTRCPEIFQESPEQLSKVLYSKGLILKTETLSVPEDSGNFHAESAANTEALLIVSHSGLRFCSV